jgi:hypothetical protein
MIVMIWTATEVLWLIKLNAIDTKNRVCGNITLYMNIARIQLQLICLHLWSMICPQASLYDIWAINFILLDLDTAYRQAVMSWTGGFLIATKATASYDEAVLLLHALLVGLRVHFSQDFFIFTVE